jgi:hypothetical protein
MPPRDPEDLAHNEGVSHDGPGFRENPAESLTGHIHSFCGRLMIEPLVVREPDRLQTLDG